VAINLNFINQSNDLNNSEIVIFQKNVATDFDELAVAWKVIQYCGQGDNHPFTFPMSMYVGASDSYGNYTPQMKAQNGELFKMALTASGDQLVAAGSLREDHQVRKIHRWGSPYTSAGRATRWWLPRSVEAATRISM